MNITSLLLTVAIGGAGLAVAVITTIRGFINARKSVEDKISKRRHHPKELHAVK